MKLLLATEKPFAPAAVDRIKEIASQADLQLQVLEKYTKEQLDAAVADADAMIVRSDIVDAELMAKAPKLKIVVRAGAGYDNIDLKAATQAGVVVENTPGQNSRAVAEMVLGMAIMALRNGFDGTTGGELSGKRLGLHGFGQVSRNVNCILSGMGLTVSAFDPFCPADAMEQAGVKPATDLQELYANNDVVSLHIPATEQTKGSINASLLNLLPKGAVLINTARKEVINEADLEKVLEERPDLKYFADVKPANADALKEKFGARVFFTPKKCGAQTREANLNAAVAAANQVVKFLATGQPSFKVN